jgi:hypothetical protein
VATPTPTGYFEFVRKYMGIPAAALPDDSFWIPATYNLSLDVVNIFLSQAPQVGSASYPNQYALAIYNYGGDRIINFATDDPINPYMYPKVIPPTPYFEYLRTKFKIDTFASGLITYAGDVTTTASFQVPDWAKAMSVADLQTLKTPWGRTYMGIASQYGPTIVDIT